MQRALALKINMIFLFVGVMMCLDPYICIAANEPKIITLIQMQVSTGSLILERRKLITILRLFLAYITNVMPLLG